MATITPADRFFSFYQLGKETTLGTAVAATTRVPFITFDWAPEDGIYRSGGMHGDYAVNRANRTGRNVAVSATIDPMEQHMPFLLAGVMGNLGTNPVTVDTTGRTWTFHDKSTAAKFAYTAEVFDGSDAYKLTGLIWNSFTLSWSQADAMTMSLSGQAQDCSILGAGNQAAMTALTDNLYDPYMSHQRIFSRGAAGTAFASLTAADLLVLSGSLTVGNGAAVRYNRNNSRNWGHVSYGQFTPELTLTVLAGENQIEFANWDGATRHSVGLEFRGSLITAAYRGIKIHGNGFWTARRHTYDGDANAYELVLAPEVNTTLGYSTAAIVTNLITTIGAA